ncbi:hypothetical protein AAC387_Pa09g1280 [Persea americana]
MERSLRKMLLVLATLLLVCVVGLEGRTLQSKPKVSHPQTFFGGFGGPTMEPGVGGGGQSPGLVWGFGSIPGFGGPPSLPSGGISVPAGPVVGANSP